VTSPADVAHVTGHPARNRMRLYRGLYAGGVVVSGQSASSLSLVKTVDSLGLGAENA